MLLPLHSVARWCSICITSRSCRPRLPWALGRAFIITDGVFWSTKALSLDRTANIYNQVVIGGGHDGPDGPPIRIIVGNRANISSAAKVMCKSGAQTIGDGSTIAANAVVLADVPHNSVAVGMPARRLPKKRPATGR